MNNNPAKKIIYPREIDSEINRYMNKKEIIAVKGPRQTGKTTLLLSIQKKLSGIKKTLFLSFEKRSDLEIFEKDIEYFRKLYVDPYEVIMLDEFQYAKSGGRQLKYLYDATGKKFIITGSSSLEFTASIGKYLAGRLFSFYLFPLSFGEYLSWKHRELSEIHHSLVRKPLKSEIMSALFEKVLEEYIIFGGYPRVILSDDTKEKQLVLSSIFEDFRVKDIRMLLNMEDEAAVMLAKLLSLQIGNLVSLKELADSSKSNYLNTKKNFRILENSYLLSRIKPFYTNKRLELTKNPKVYFYDTGMRNFLIQNFNGFTLRTDKVALIENYIFNYLRLKYQYLPVRFWRTKSQAEVDFIVEKEGEIIPYEVKYTQSKEVTLGKSFISFITKFQPEKAYMITKNYRGKRKLGKTEINFQPAYSL